MALKTQNARTREKGEKSVYESRVGTRPNVKLKFEKQNWELQLFQILTNNI